MISPSRPAVIVWQWRQVFIMLWQDLTPSRYEGQGGGTEGRRDGGVRGRGRGTRISSPLCTHKEVKGRLYVVARGSLEWLHGSCRVALRVSFG